MGESSENGYLKIREPYDPMLRPILLLNAVIIAGFGVFSGYGDLHNSGESGLKVIGAAVATIACFVCTYGLWRADLELRINDERIAARAWPFPSKVVPVDQVLMTEVVKIDPMRDYGGGVSREPGGTCSSAEAAPRHCGLPIPTSPARSAN